MIIILTKADTSLRSEISKNVWKVITEENPVEKLKILQEAVHTAWKIRINRAEMELAQRVKVIELMNYETVTSREYGLRQACNDLTEEFDKIRAITSELSNSNSLAAADRQLLNKMNEDLIKINHSINQVRNICLESNHQNASINL